MNELQYIKENYGKRKAKYIAKKLGISIHRVYNLAKEHNLTRKENPIFNINKKQEQILISGNIGDGGFKKNGNNYYYRECHAVTEKDYLMWKFNELKELTTKKIYNIESRGVNQNKQVGFQTRNSPTFEKYALMNIKESINRLDKLGLILLFLDDGWCRRYTHSFGYNLSVYSMSEDMVDLLVLRIKEVLNINVSITDSYNVISINSKESPKLLKVILEYLPSELDILENKFGRYLSLRLRDSLGPLLD